MKHRALRAILAATLLCALSSLAGCASRASSSAPAAANSAPMIPATAPVVPAAVTSATDAPTTFAIIGDYGMDDAHERAVAKLVASWKPAYVLALGDDYYAHAGGTGTGRYDESTGAYYGKWLKDISTTGHRYPVGKAAVNAFFPALGNHDYSDATPSPKTYLTYFRLPGAGFHNTSGNERYYDFIEGPAHFFVLNSDAPEPDGTSSTSKQAKWLKAQLAASTSAWNIVYDHHPPYSSCSTHGSSTFMRWPFAAWGADVVLSGHAHVYERVARNGIVYFVNGLGGGPRYKFKKAPVAGSKIRYRANWGAQRASVTSSTLDFRFYSVSGKLVDHYRSSRP